MNYSHEKLFFQLIRDMIDVVWLVSADEDNSKQQLYRLDPVSKANRESERERTERARMEPHHMLFEMPAFYVGEHVLEFAAEAAYKFIVGLAASPDREVFFANELTIYESGYLTGRIDFRKAPLAEDALKQEDDLNRRCRTTHRLIKKKCHKELFQRYSDTAALICQEWHKNGKALRQSKVAVLTVAKEPEQQPIS
jgi:hypothetical protein